MSSRTVFVTLEGLSPEIHSLGFFFLLSKKTCSIDCLFHISCDYLNQCFYGREHVYRSSDCHIRVQRSEVKARHASLKVLDNGQVLPEMSFAQRETSTASFTSISHYPLRIHSKVSTAHNRSTCICHGLIFLILSCCVCMYLRVWHEACPREW